MIFYLAILLILCGFLIVICALFIEISETKRAEAGATSRLRPTQIRRMPGAVKTNNSGNFKPKSNQSGNLEIISPEQLDDKNSIFSEFEATLSDLPEQKHVFKEDTFDTIAELDPEPDIEIETADNVESNIPLQENNAVYAVMFDDRSGIIDYTSGIGTIDSTFLKYNDIKRIGRGIIESDSDGINFYLDEKLYRFDSHRIYDIWCGENYVALPLKGNDIVRLFIIENSADFPYKAESDFKGAHVQ